MGTYQAHETAVIDAGCTIGEGTRIWHFSHLMAGCVVGRDCNIGQNVVISPGVVLGNRVKVQNNVSVYTGVTCGDEVFLGPSCVFTNVINPRSAISRKDQYKETPVDQGATQRPIQGNTCGPRSDNWGKCNDCLRTCYRQICHDWSRRSGDKRCSAVCFGDGKSRPSGRMGE